MRPMDCIYAQDATLWATAGWNINGMWFVYASICVHIRFLTLLTCVISLSHTLISFLGSIGRYTVNSVPLKSDLKLT